MCYCVHRVRRIVIPWDHCPCFYSSFGYDMNWAQSINILIRDHVRMVQWFMLCRHAGVLLASVIIARVLPLEDVGQFEMLMLCGYLVTFFWSEAWLKGYLTRYDQADQTGQAGSFVWLYALTGLLVMGIFLLANSWLLPLIVNRSTLDGLFWFAAFQVCILPVWIAPFTGVLKGPQVWWMGWYVLIIPALAAWAGWMSYLFEKSVAIGDGTMLIPAPLVERWQRQMNTAYADLPESEKASDRAEADKILAIVAPDGVLIGGSEFELQQRIIPLARALLEAGMDGDMLLERMMGLQ